MSSYDGSVVAQLKGAFSSIDRDDIVRRARGVIAETVNSAFCGNTGVSTSGVASFVPVGLRAGDVVTNINTFVATAGATVTVSKVGLYDKNGNQLGVSLDQGTSWQSAGYKPIALITPYTVSVTDVYYCGILAVFSVTSPTIPRGSFNTGLAPYVVGANFASWYAQSGLADLPSPATYSTSVIVGSGCWYMAIT